MNPYFTTQPPAPSGDETPFRRQKRRGIALPFLQQYAEGHDLLVMNQHPDLTDQSVETSANTVFNVDLP